MADGWMPASCMTAWNTATSRSSGNVSLTVTNISFISITSQTKQNLQITHTRLNEITQKHVSNNYNVQEVTEYCQYVQTRDDNGNGIPIPIGNPVGIPWEWELVTQMGIRMGRNGNHPI